MNLLLLFRKYNAKLVKQQLFETWKLKVLKGIQFQLV